MCKYVYKNVQFTDTRNNKIIVSSKISVKIILMTKPIILNPNNQKTNKKQIIVGFGGKFLKFCLRIKTFLQMLEKEIFFAKFRTIILNIT